MEDDVIRFAQALTQFIESMGYSANEEKDIVGFINGWFESRWLNVKGGD